jgi:hypothetical protein
MTNLGELLALELVCVALAAGHSCGQRPTDRLPLLKQVDELGRCLRIRHDEVERGGGHKYSWNPLASSWSVERVRPGWVWCGAGGASA